MVLFFSEYADVVTDNIIMYLQTSGNKVIRINYPEKYLLKRIQINSKDSFIQLSYHNKNIDLNKISKVYFRRGRVKLSPHINHSEDCQLINDIKSFLYKEEEIIIRYIEKHLGLKTIYIGSYSDEFDNNKLSQLNNAIRSSLLIPDTLITSSKAELIEFGKKHKQIITKDLRYLPDFNYKNKRYLSKGTQLISKDDISTLPDSFCPMFFQERIEKKYEIRIFFMGKETFAMCIFSQSDKKTQIDFRYSNKQQPTRTVPYKLPEEIKGKLLDFISLSELTTGSIDLIYSTNNKYYFLEVNPSGQYHWVSHNCNFDIEQHIANILT